MPKRIAALTDTAVRKAKPKEQNCNLSALAALGDVVD